jgi:hypothetical protein
LAAIAHEEEFMQNKAESFMLVASSARVKLTIYGICHE